MQEAAERLISSTQGGDAGAQTSAEASLVLPHFIGIGPPRTATTWLNGVLKGHARLPLRIKETDFFSSDRQYARGFGFYASVLGPPAPGLKIGEFSPRYFFSLPAIRRIRRAAPDCRIVCTLREPVERLYSHYRLLVRDARTRLPFERAIDQEADLAASSRYTFYLQAWFDAFGADRVRVFLYEDLKRDAQRFLDDLCEFAGIQPFTLEDSESGGKNRVNAMEHRPRTYMAARVATIARRSLSSLGAHRLLEMWGRSLLGKQLSAVVYDGQPIPLLEPGTRARLRHYFRPEVETLEKMIGRDLSAWKGN